MENTAFDFDKTVRDLKKNRIELDFDLIAQNYDEIYQNVTKAAGFPVGYVYEHKASEIHRALSGRPGFPSAPVILDFGCGIGIIDPYLRKYFPDSSIYGVDTSAESIRLAKGRNGALNISYAVIDESRDDFPFEVQFDLVYVSGVFHHIARRDHLSVFARIKALLKPGGLLFAQEPNPYNPAVQILVFHKYDKQFDPNAKMLRPYYMRNQMKKAGLAPLRTCYEIFFPAFLSALLPLEKHMRFLPLGARYYVIAESGKSGAR